MSSPVIGRVQKLGLRPLENGDESARLFLVDGVEVTMPMSAVACPICFAKFDEEGAPIPEGQKKLLHLKVKCTTCLKMVCSSCSKLVRLESYGETESRKICFPCLEDVKKKIGHFKTAGRGSGRAAPPEADRKAVSGPWSPATGRGMTRRASVGGRGEGRGRGSGEAVLFCFFCLLIYVLVEQAFRLQAKKEEEKREKCLMLFCFSVQGFLLLVVARQKRLREQALQSSKPSMRVRSSCINISSILSFLFPSIFTLAAFASNLPWRESV